MRGDVFIDQNTIQMVDGDELLKQSAESVIGTNKKEWFLNEDEGINFDNLFQKVANEELILNELVQGLAQIDQSFVVVSFNVERAERGLHITFSARNDKGEVIEGSNEIT